MSSEIGRRIRAARALSGFKNQEVLAEASGVGVDKIKRMESGQRAAALGEIPAIAKACELPEAFFEVDFSELSGSKEAAQTGVEIDALRNELLAELAGVQDALAEQRSLLESVERKLGGGGG